MEIIFDFSDNSNQSPNWFDWLSLAVSVLSIIIAYLWGRYIYKTEKEDKQNEELENIKSEKQLFDDNLSMLQKCIKEQIRILKKYKRKDNIPLTTVPNMRINFLKFINIKSLYKNNDKDKINNVLSNLYKLDDFEIRLTDETKLFLHIYDRYNNKFIEKYEELIFIKRMLLYREKEKTPFIDRYLETIRDVKFTYLKGKKLISLLEKILDDTITFGKGKDKDINIIEINILANRTRKIYKKMQKIKKEHIHKVNDFITTLKEVNNAIDIYKN